MEESDVIFEGDGRVSGDIARVSTECKSADRVSFSDICGKNDLAKMRGKKMVYEVIFRVIKMKFKGFFGRGNIKPSKTVIRRRGSWDLKRLTERDFSWEDTSKMTVRVGVDGILEHATFRGERVLGVEIESLGQLFDGGKTVIEFESLLSTDSFNRENNEEPQVWRLAKEERASCKSRDRNESYGVRGERVILHRSQDEACLRVNLVTSPEIVVRDEEVAMDIFERLERADRELHRLLTRVALDCGVCRERCQF